MKQLSIKMKVTIWYTAFVVVIAAAALLVVAFSAEKILMDDQQEKLKNGVEEFVEEIEIEDGHYESGESFYDDDIVYSIYNNEGKMIDGRVPSQFPEDTVLKNYTSQEIDDGNMQWMTFDIAIKVAQEEYIWVRGIMYIGQVAAMETIILWAAMIGFPGLVLLAAIGGYLITKRAFVPVEQIRTTAQEIAENRDLKRRVSPKTAKGEFKELADTFNGMLDTLEQTFEDEKQFTADASHELRTPISVVIAQSEYGILDDTTDEERKEALEIILKQGQKMSVLITQLLEISRNESNKDQSLWSEIELGQLAMEVGAELQAKALEKQIQIDYACEEEVFVFAEKTGMERIFRNLIENAIQYGKENGNIWVKLFRRENQIICSIKDDGIGIAKENLPHIFKRFYRVDKVRTGKSKSHAGLGLSMVALLVENYHGSIEVKSEPGEGSEFTLVFPLYEKDNIRYNK